MSSLPSPSSAAPQYSSAQTVNTQYQSQYHHQRYAHNNDQIVTLWMGDIEQSMDEAFIKTSFNLMQEKVVNVKIVRDKSNGLPLGYGFISLETEKTPEEVLHKIDGQIIPNGVNGKRFRLNKTSVRDRQYTEYSIFVGDLTPDVDDYTLLAVFGALYKSTSSAKVMTRPDTGESKGFGFVRFSDAADYRAALNQNGKLNITGSGVVHVKPANPRKEHNYYNYHQKMHTPKKTFALSPDPPIQEAYYPEPNLCYGNNCYGLNPYNYPYTPVMNLYQPIPAPYQYDAYGYAQSPNVPNVPRPQFYCISENGQILFPAVLTPSHMNQFLVEHGNGPIQSFDAAKLNEEMVAKSDDLYSSLEHPHWNSGVDCDKETV